MTSAFASVATARSTPRERIAIIGTGVSGLVAAHTLAATTALTLFEATDRVGGHVHTWDIPLGGRSWSVDTGFIVYNERNYPNFSALLRSLGVATQASTMSFSMRDDRSGVEYNGSSWRQLFAQPRNALRPSFLRMLREILRFNDEAVARAAAAPGATLNDLLRADGYSRAFRDWYLVPMGAAIWSLPAADVLEMPADFFVRFFDNHGMLTVQGRPQWRTIQGGSARYVEALIPPFADRIRLRTPVRRVKRFAGHVEVNGERFDRVLFACHSDQALAALTDATPREREILGALPYQLNDMVLHTDTSVLPKSRRAWGAWNYRVREDPRAPVAVTYNMNALQSLDAPETFCVTLNETSGIDPARVLGTARYAHPVATPAGSAARARHSEISGAARTYYAGAYWGNGFHEDGVSSGLAAAEEICAAARTRAAEGSPRTPEAA